MEPNKAIGTTMLVAGFLFILANAIDYIAKLDSLNPCVFLFGIIFVAIGILLIQRGKRK